MGYSKVTRKWGDGYTYWKVHATTGDQAGSPFDGEWDIETMAALTTPDFGGYSEGAEFRIECENFSDEITQEYFPVQNPIVGAVGVFEVTMSMGLATNLAIAAGLSAATSESDILAAGDDADTVVFGVREPATFSLIHKVINPHEAANGYYDWVFAPRCQVQGNVTLKFNKKEVRVAVVSFNLFPSHQDGTTSGSTTSEDFQLSNGTGGVFKTYNQTAT